MDHCFGRVLKALDESGQADDTVILYISDHGDMMGDLGFWTKQVMYDASAGVPMIMAGPDIPEGRRVRTATSLVDVAETAREIAALEQATFGNSGPGRSLREIAQNPDDLNRTIFSEYHDGGSTTGTFMVRWQQWKYVYYVGHSPQLFNLISDPNELSNLADKSDGDPVIQEVLAEGERRLREICDPEAVNARCFSDQKRRIEELGGEEACQNAYVFNHTPTPNEQLKMQNNSNS